MTNLGFEKLLAGRARRDGSYIRAFFRNDSSQYSLFSFNFGNNPTTVNFSLVCMMLGLPPENMCSERGLNDLLPLLSTRRADGVGLPFFFCFGFREDDLMFSPGRGRCGRQGIMYEFICSGRPPRRLSVQ